MKKTYLIVVIVIVLGILFSLNQREQKTSSMNSIKIGGVISLSGPAASFGEYAKNGMNLAAKEINDKGGIDGRKVEIIYEDDKTNPKDAVSSYKKLVSVDNVQGVIGGLWDFVSQPLLPLAEQTKVAYISPSNFRIEGKFEPNSQSFLMLTEFKNVLQKAQDFLKRDDVKKIAVVHFKSTFGEEIARAFNQMTMDLGKGPMINESYSNFGSAEFKTTITKLKQQNIDTVFLDAVDVDAVNFLKRSKELNFTPKIITYVGSYDAFTGENKSLLEGITILDWESSRQAFVDRYQKAYGSVPAKSAQHGYDATYVLANAIAHTKSTAEVAQYIGTHTFETANGKIEFLPTHEVSSTDVTLKTYRGGELVPYAY